MWAMDRPARERGAGGGEVCATSALPIATRSQFLSSSQGFASNVQAAGTPPSHACLKSELVAVVVGVDVLFFRNRFWERRMANVGIVLVFTAFYLRFVKRP
jgi:hypothetical protein